MLRIEFARHHAKAGALRSRRRLEDSLQLDARRGEAAVKPHHHGALALRVGLVDCRQFLSRQTQGFLDKNVAMPGQCPFDQRRVKGMASRDEDRLGGLNYTRAGLTGGF